MSSITPVSNTVVFVLPTNERLSLRLTAPWTRNVGIGPDVNGAIISWKEWESIGDTSAPLIGDVLFYYGQMASGVTLPDVTIKLQQIIDVSPESWGQRADATKAPPTNVASLPVEIISYKVFFADVRHRFTHPFGGRVTLGEVNKTPLTVGGSFDANGYGLLNPQQLAVACLVKMGINPSKAPNTLSDTAKQFDLQWRGNHAPTELEKILTFAQHTMGVAQDGTLSIHMLGTGRPPVIPANSKVAVLPFQAIERRGQAVVFTSSPHAILETKTITGPFDGDGNDSWELVLQDKDGAWQTYANSGYFKSETDALKQWQDGLLKTISPTDFYRISGQMFRCIRLNVDNYGPAPLHRTLVVDENLRPTDLKVMAKIATPDAQGSFANNSGFINLRTMGLHDEGKVIQLFERLLQTDATTTSDFPDIARHSKLIGNNDLQVRCTREVHEFDAKAGRWAPGYYELGYKQNLGGPVEVTGAALQNLTDGGDVPVYHMPNLRLLRVDGVDVNASRLHDYAIVEASSLLAGSGNPAEQHIAKGFLAGELNGIVHKIEYHQDQPHTIFHVNTFFLPSTEALPRFLAVDAQTKNDAFPKQQDVSSARTAAGQSGYTQQSVPIQSWVSDPAPANLVKVKITDASSAGRGKYNGGIVGGSSTADESSPLNEPEGMIDPALTNVLICNLAEDNSIIHGVSKPDHGLPVGYYLGKVVGGGSNGLTVEIDSDRCGALTTQNLQHTDSSSDIAEQDKAIDCGRISVDLTFVSRVSFNPDFDKTIYAFYRTLTIDCGKITNITVEHRKVILPFKDCT